jgi:hypothetical protein
MRAALGVLLCLATASVLAERRPAGTLDVFQIVEGGEATLNRHTMSYAARDATGASSRQTPASKAAGVDFEFFKTKVQPIFVARRPGHARCISCHIAGTPMRFQPLQPGSSTWSEEDSRKNFEAVVQRVVPGNPQSRLLVHPLLEAAGGDFYHNGGKHWKSQNDPEWQTLKAWVMGQTAK